jgi:hypothetical protein
VNSDHTRSIARRGGGRFEGQEGSERFVPGRGQRGLDAPGRRRRAPLDERAPVIQHEVILHHDSERWIDAK